MNQEWSIKKVAGFFLIATAAVALVSGMMLGSQDTTSQTTRQTPNHTQRTTVVTKGGVTQIPSSPDTAIEKTVNPTPEAIIHGPERNSGYVFCSILAVVITATILLWILRGQGRIKFELLVA